MYITALLSFVLWNNQMHSATPHTDSPLLDGPEMKACTPPPPLLLFTPSFLFNSQ